MNTFVLAGGCFWCLDAVYRTLEGVSDVVSGYTGGTTVHPDYDSVCTGLTGHAEAVAVTFDPGVIPDSVILDVFFTLHDPRQLNRQGNDVGTQYRSAMFSADAAQHSQFAEAIDRASDLWDGPVATTLEPLGDWYRAEQEPRTGLLHGCGPAQGQQGAQVVQRVRQGGLSRFSAL
jgi:peptide-methionine (S)-S-oxide reductase